MNWTSCSRLNPPWLTIGGLALAVLVVLAIAVLLLARRHFRGGLLREVGR